MVLNGRDWVTVERVLSGDLWADPVPIFETRGTELLAPVRQHAHVPRTARHGGYLFQSLVGGLCRALLTVHRRSFESALVGVLATARDRC